MLIKQGKTNIKYLLIVVILAVVVGGGILWCITKEKTPDTQLLEEKEIEKSFIIQQVLSNKEVNEILREFAEGKTFRFNDVGADKVLLDALEFKNGEIKSRLRSIKINIENLSDEIQDAPDMRSLFTQQVKTCIAESIIYDDIKSILKYCGYQQNKEPINLAVVDDLTATEQILPHFIAGFSYYSEEDYSRADYYFEQIKLHRAELEKYGYGNESYLELYNKIYNKVLEISSDTAKDETSDWQTYRNEEYGFEIEYLPNKSSLELVNKGSGYFDFTTFEVITIDTSLNQETSLSTGSPTGRITIYVDRDPIWLESCLESKVISKTIPDDVKEISGVEFSMFDESSAAMGGQRGDEKSYRTFHNNACYRIQSLVLWRSVDFYHGATDLEPVTEEELQEQNKLIKNQANFNEQIFSTFRFLD